MDWQGVSNISSVVTIVCAILSGISWYKTKGYYSKIAKSNSFEKLSSFDNILIEIRELYESIKRFHLTESKRGKNPQKIVDNHLNIEIKLNQIRNKIPSKYEEILNSINKANEQINKIGDKQLYFENNPYFKDLGTYLTNIEDGIKLEKENIRGF